MGNLFVWVLTAFFAAKTGVSGVAKNIKSKSGNTKWPLILGGIVVLYLFWKEYQKAQSQNEAQAIGNPNNLAATFAARLSSAMNLPSFEYLDAITNTDEDSIYSIAQEMRASGVTLAQVWESYNRLYQRDIQYDLSKRALDNKEYTKFLSILSGAVVVSSGSSGSGNTTPTLPSKTPTTPATPSVPQNNGGGVTGSASNPRQVFAVANVNVRQTRSPYAVWKTIAKGSVIGDYSGQSRFVVNGLTMPCYDVRINGVYFKVSSSPSYVVLK